MNCSKWYPHKQILNEKIQTSDVDDPKYFMALKSYGKKENLLFRTKKLHEYIYHCKKVVS